MIITLRCLQCDETESARSRQEEREMYARWHVSKRASLCPSCRKLWLEENRPSTIGGER